MCAYINSQSVDTSINRDYSTYSYREIQALIQLNRGGYSNVPKLTSKRYILEQWLIDNITTPHNDNGDPENINIEHVMPSSVITEDLGSHIQNVYIEPDNPITVPNMRYSDNYMYSYDISSEFKGSYDISDSLGEGSFGSVIRAKGEDNKAYAIKIFESESFYAIPQSSIIEITALIRLNHPNIIGITSVFIDRSFEVPIAIVMEQASSNLQNIDNSVKKTLNLDVVSYGILCGMSYLHSLHIIHRDIKLENILYFPNGDVKIADFGSSKHYACFPRGDWTEEVTSLWYRAPEIILGVEEYGIEIDIWSVGAMLYQWYTYNVFVSGDNELEQITGYVERISNINWEYWNTKPRKPRMFNFINLKLLEQVATANKLYILPDIEFKKATHNQYHNLIYIILDMMKWVPEDRISMYDALRNNYWDEIRTKELEYTRTECFNNIKSRERYPNLPDNIFLTKYSMDTIHTQYNLLLNYMEEFKFRLRTYICAVQYFREILNIMLYNKNILDLYNNTSGMRLLLYVCFNLSITMNEESETNFERFFAWKHYIGIIQESKGLSLSEATIYVDKEERMNKTESGGSSPEAKYFSDAEEDVVMMLRYDLVITTPLDYEKMYKDMMVTTEQISMWRFLIVYFCTADTIYYNYPSRDIATICYELVKFGGLRDPKFVGDSSILNAIRLGMSGGSQNEYLGETYKILKQIGLRAPITILKL